MLHAKQRPCFQCNTSSRQQDYEYNSASDMNFNAKVIKITCFHDTKRYNIQGFCCSEDWYNGLLDYDTMQSGKQAGRYKHFKHTMPTFLTQQSLKLQTGTPI